MFTTRKRQTLDGAWLFSTDARDSGERDGWPDAAPPEAFDVAVPHIWQREKELVDYQGAAWYFRAFTPEFAPDGGKRLHLCFEAVDYRTRVWLNGREVGVHEGGFLPFSFDVTDALVANGTNRLAVRVFDPRDNAEIPIGKQGSWYTRVSGIWQSVYLEERAPAYIASAHVLPKPPESGFAVRIVPGGDFPESAVITYRVTEHLGDRKVKAEGKWDWTAKAPAHFVAVPDAVCWEPDNPFLYELALSRGDDEYTTVFGIRSVEADGNAYLLNGKTPVRMRGALDQAFHPDTIYTPPSEEAIIAEINLAKKMGFNLLRKHIKAELPRYLYWADRLGMLIWAEYPNYAKWTVAARERFSAQLLEMADRDFNHPSIIIWSLYNEEWGLEWDLAAHPEKQRHVAELYDALKAFDPTRLICDNSGWEHVKTDINDYHRYFILPEQADAWRRDFEEVVTETGDNNFISPARNNRQPLAVSEFGNWSFPDPDALCARYGGEEPWWLTNQGEAEHQDDFRQPQTARERFEPLGLKRIFGSFAGLSEHSVRRMYRSVKASISEMRMTLRSIGYVVTEFTDIEWETNGWLDFFREIKPGFENAAEFNGPLCAFLDMKRRSWWCGENAAFDLVVCNDRQIPLDARLEWAVDGAGVRGAELVKDNGDAAGVRIAGLSFTVPELSAPVNATFHLRLLGADGTALAENREEITLVPRRRNSGTVAVHALPDGFARALAETGWDVVDLSRHRPGVVIVAGALDNAAETLLRNGERVVFLAENGDAIEDKCGFSFRELDRGESWPRASSFQYVDADRFPGAPLRKETGWETDGILPDWIVPTVDYQKTGSKRTVHFFADTRLTERCTPLAGYFQGWLGQSGLSMLEMPFGKGRLFLTTWRLSGTYGRHPVGTTLLDGILSGV